MSNPDFGRGTLARYHLVEKIGAGGMGEVYRAHDEQLGRDVALKVLPDESLGDPVAQARLRQEARAAAALNHPHICTVYEVGESDGKTYIAMELVEGQPLSDRLKDGPLSPDEVARYGLQLADALAHAHSRGVVHRDLKSANIIVRPDGRVKVLDFGLAKRLTASELTAAVTRDVGSLTQPGTIMGTVAYMAPEQLRGESAQMSSDIWALGVVLHEMASGGRPFTGHTGFELSAAILGQPPAPLPAVVEPLPTIIGRCLEKEPARRYQNGSEVHAVLDTLRQGQAVASTPVGPSEDPTRVSPPESGLRVPSHDAQPSSPGTMTVTMSRRQALGLGGLAIATVTALVVGVVTWQTGSSGGPVHTLAVLPFDNALADTELAYLSEGVTESLITQVASLPSLRVTPVSAVLNFQDLDIDPADAGRQLGVESVVAGSLHVENERILITATLFDAVSGDQLWTSSFDRALSELLDLQDEVATAIAEDGLRIELTTDQRVDLTTRPTVDGDAYDLYLQAQYLQRRATENDYLEAVELLEGATVRDPRFVDAHLLMAGVYMALAIDGFMRPTDAWALANRRIRLARDIDPDLPNIRAIQHALAFFYDWDWEGAARERERALQTSVGEFDPDHLRSFSLALLALGQTEEALDLARRSRELDPLSIGLAMLEGDYLVHDGRLDDAIAVYERAIAVESDNADAYFGLAEAYVRQGRFDAASAARRQAHSILGDSVQAELFGAAEDEEGYYLADEAYVRLQLEWLEAREPWGYVSPLDFARVYAQLGEADRAFEYLDQAFEHRSPGLVLLTIDQAFDRIRDDARFDDVLRQVGFPQLAD